MKTPFWHGLPNGLIIKGSVSCWKYTHWKMIF